MFNFKVPLKNIGDISELFYTLSDKEVFYIKKFMKDSKFPPNIPVCAAGRPGDGLFLINKGSVRVVLDGKDIAVLNKGEVFGEISFLLDKDFSASIFSNTDCELTYFPKSEFDKLKKNKSELAIKIILCLTEVISKRLVSSNKKTY